MFVNTSATPKHSSHPPRPQSGYDLPIYGLDNGDFLSIHVPAIICIFISLISVIYVLVSSFKNENCRLFFSWPKPQRFVVYLAICDGMYNLCHSMDHIHILITRNHVYPKSLCTFYGFMLAEFITSQNLMVNVVCVNAFTLVYFRKNLNFGRYDYRILLWTFGLPFIGAIIAVSLKTMGSNGTFCYFDPIKGELANIFFTTIPLFLILIVNIILYSLTWYRIYKEEPHFKTNSSRNAATVRASHRAARTMCLFVTAFFIQWWAMAVYGIVQLVSKNNLQLLFHFVTTFTNIGGLLNAVVYVIMKKTGVKTKTKFKEHNVVFNIDQHS